MEARSGTRIGVVAGYMDFFDGIMPEGYREEKRQWAKTLAELFRSEGTELVFPGLLVTREDGVRAGRLFAERDVDAILVIPTMAAPPDYSWEAVKNLEHAPLIVWDAHEMTRIPDDYTMKDLVRHSSNVGSIMFTNTALRHGRRIQVFVSSFEDVKVRNQVRDALQVGALAGKLRRGKIGVIGSPIDGYVNVLADDAEVKESIGPAMQRVGADEFTREFRSVTPEALAQKRAWMEQNGKLESVPELELEKSLGLAVALENLTARYGWLGGAFNCRAEVAVKNPEIGVIGCLGVSYMTTIGKPFTCTGDIVTSLAMIVSKQLGSNVLYCECDQIDYERDYMLMANTGESDFCFSCEKPCIVSTGGHSGQTSRGASLFVRGTAGPATLIGLSPKREAKGGWTLIAAPGEILGTAHEELRVGNAMFRFKHGPTAEAFRRWCLAGATHHGALSTGDLTEKLLMLGDMLGIETVII